MTASVLRPGQSQGMTRPCALLMKATMLWLGTNTPIGPSRPGSSVGDVLQQFRCRLHAHRAAPRLPVHLRHCRAGVDPRRALRDAIESNRHPWYAQSHAATAVGGQPAPERSFRPDQCRHDRSQVPWPGAGPVDGFHRSAPGRHLFPVSGTVEVATGTACWIDKLAPTTTANTPAAWVGGVGRRGYRTPLRRCRARR